jgi:hypothetical protein
MSLIGGVLLPSLLGGIVATPVLYRILIDNGWDPKVTAASLDFPDNT